MDFADHAGRAVVITGLPFATLTDAKVCLIKPIALASALYKIKVHLLTHEILLYAYVQHYLASCTITYSC